MTYRELLLWLEKDSKTREDSELDMPVLLRVQNDDADCLVGDLISVAVDPGCTESDALVLDGSEAEPAEEKELEEDWIVREFNPDTLCGLVAKRSSPKYVLSFHSTSFSAPTHRWPYRGEVVKVVFDTTGRPLAVHGR